MAISVARVHLKVAHAALPALLPTPPKSKMLPQVPTPPCVAAIFRKPSAKPGRADSDERWDAHKAKPPACCPASSSALPGRRSPLLATIRSSAARASSSEISEPRKNARTTSPPVLKPGRADAVERWDAHKKAPIPASSSSSSSLASSSKWVINRATSSERWDVHKKQRSPQPQAKLIDDGESRSIGSYGMDMEEEEEEEILWKPRAMYAGPGFIVAAPEAGMLPMPTAFLVPVA